MTSLTGAGGVVEFSLRNVLQIIPQAIIVKTLQLLSTDGFTLKCP